MIMTIMTTDSGLALFTVIFLNAVHHAEGRALQPSQCTRGRRISPDCLPFKTHA